MEWFLNHLMSYERAEQKAAGASIYDMANAWVESITPEDSDVIFLPYLNGSNVNPLARGSFIGLTAYHNKKYMLRAVYEGIVFSHAMHVERLLRNREKPQAIQLAGGAANSRVWVQIFADVLQLPIETIEDKELGAQGAAMAAGIAVGIYRDYDDAIVWTVRITDRVEPRKEYAGIYQKKFGKFKRVVEALDPIWNDLED